jgi:murein DD-endopeptidase MepM/ murein hydrolase activator NlpD
VIDAIAKAVGNLDIALSTWLELQIEHVDWKGLGESFGRFLAGVLLPNTQAAVDGIGPGLKPETVRAAIRDFFIGVIEGAFAEIKPALQKAWDDAIRSITPTRPNWWPASVPWPFGPQPGSGMEFPASPGAGGGSPGAAGGGPVQQGAQPYDPNSWEGTAYRAAVDAGHPDPIQFVEQMRQESNFDPDVISGRRRSSAGAIGIAQFMPATAASLGVDPLDPQASLDAAARLMKSYYDKYGDSATALAAYNAGEGAVQRYGGVPPYTETRSYVSTITQRTEAARQANPINVTGQGSPQVAGGGQATGMPDPNEMVTIESNTGGRLQAPRSMIGEGPGQYSADPDRGGYHIVADAAAPASMQTMAATARPQYTLPIEGMGTAQPHWGESMGGSDIFAPEGTPVHSVGDGTVISIGSGGPGGNSVLIQGDDGNQYYYAHLQGTPDVKRGQRVSVGDVLGGVGTTGNAAGTPPHLHLGIGQSIQNGVGPEGGVGTPLAGGGNAIQFLNDIRDGKYGEPLQTLQKQLDDSGQSLSMLDQEAAAAGVKLEDLGTDAATAANDGVAPLQTAVADTSTAVAGMSEATLTATTDMSTGLTETLGVAATGVVQTFTDMSGNVVGQVAQLADGTTVTMGDMAAGVATTVTDMGTGIQTVMTDTAGNAITTVTDMAGNVVSQTVGMGVDSTAAATQMATDVEAQAAVMAAQAILEAAGMQTGVTGAATAMATDSAAQLDALAGSAEGSFGTVVEAAGSVAEPLGTAASDIGAVGGAANGATGPIDTFAGALDSVPDLDMSKTISELEDVKSAAEDAAKAVDDIGSSGDGGKSKKNGKSGKGGGNKNKASDDGDSGDGGDGGDGGDEQGFAIGGVLPEDIFGRGLSGKRYRLHGNEVVLSPAGRGGSGPDGSLDIDYDKLAAAFIRAGAGQKNLSVTVNTQAKESSLLHDVEILEAMAGGR